MLKLQAIEVLADICSREHRCYEEYTPHPPTPVAVVSNKSCQSWKQEVNIAQAAASLNLY